MICTLLRKPLNGGGYSLGTALRNAGHWLLSVWSACDDGSHKVRSW